MKKLSKWDILDYLWQEIYNDAKNNVEYPKDLKIKDWALSKTQPFINQVKSSYTIEGAIESFCFEINYCVVKPNRDTLKWSDGDHATLYDQYTCKDHKLVVTTHDDERFIPGGTVFCPECNKDILRENKTFPYEYRILSDSEFTDYMKYSEFVKKWNRKENRKYRIKRFFKNLKWFFTLAHYDNTYSTNK